MKLGSSDCHLCQGEPESTLHVLRDYPRAYSVWIKLVRQIYLKPFFDVELKDWLALNLHELEFGFRIWAFVCRSLYPGPIKRCMMFLLSGDEFAWLVILNFNSVYVHAANAHITTTCSANHTIQASWRPPHFGWVKLNTDWAVEDRGARADCGGLSRGENGAWICDFSKFLGSCSALVGGLWGVHEGVHLNKSRGFSHVQVDVDSMLMAQCLNDSYQVSPHATSHVNHIRKLMTKDSEIKIAHFYRVANLCADVLASLGYDEQVLKIWIAFCI